MYRVRNQCFKRKIEKSNGKLGYRYIYIGIKKASDFICKEDRKSGKHINTDSADC